MTWWSKLHFWFPEDISGEIIFFFTKSSKLSVVFRFWGKHFGFLAKIILLGCRKCFQVSRGYFWKKVFLKINSLNCFFNFGLRAQFFCTFSENFAIGLSKLHSMCPVEIFDWNDFPTKLYEYFHRLRGVRKTVWHFSAKASRSLSKVQIMCKKN